MASDRFEIEPAPKEKSGWRGCLIGCLITAAILGLIAVIGIWWVANNIKDLAVSVGTKVIEAGIEESGLPDQEKAELKVELKRLGDGFADGSISNEQMLRVVEGLAQSPLLSMFMVSAIETHYVVNSGLTDEEKTDATLTLRRFARGLMGKQIGQDDLDEVLSHIADRDADGDLQIREKVSDEDLRAFLADAKQKADDAEIPVDLEPVDPSDELKNIIDTALAEQ